ncbi:hypothetical protein [Amycolatopsis sp. FDAARGOS 1241]|uniref:hypothetical protein n=1 Tax=Amycolatopsis sp. FDAARGOS 1241 TaxID=2778070 RepID=UPI001951273B|nr:hypothetical protein [Amycolatopsis sp. FDAARGOS 1241]QRP47224.1 hypothetical protein I6J71_04235 [Amycolatopsis sp. FDAARGOS 1241]
MSQNPHDEHPTTTTTRERSPMNSDNEIAEVHYLPTRRVDTAPAAPDTQVIDGEVMDGDLLTAEEYARIQRAKAIERYRGYRNDVVTVVRTAKTVATHERTRTAVRVSGYTVGVLAGPVVGVWASWEQFHNWRKAAEHREGGSHRHEPVPERAAAQMQVQARREAQLATLGRALSSKPAAAFYGLVTLAEVPAVVDWALNGWPVWEYGQVVATIDLATAGGLLAALTVNGWAHLRKVWKKRNRKRVGTVADAGDTLPVLPIAEARHDRAALELLRRSLLAQGVEVNPITGRRTAWGWELEMQIVGGSGKRPADVIKKLEQIETDLDVRQNGVLVQPHTDRRARFTTRIIESDPWASMPPLPVYRPGERCLADPIELGLRLDGRNMSASFQSTHAIILAASGGGKSGKIRAIVDGLAHTNDAILWDLDPSGVGQAPQADAMGLRALSPEDCEVALETALRIANARTRIKDRLGMGDEWQPSPQHPALVVVLDEFPRLTKEGKALAVALLRVARKAGVVIIFASQSAKKDALGDSVAAEVAFKAAGPGLADYQTRLLFGDNATSEGYTPGNYRPKRGSRLNDTGTFFLEGCMEGDEPIPTRVLWIDNTVAAQRARRAAAAGRPEWDAVTLSAAGLTLTQVSGATSPEDAALAQRAAFDDEQRRARLGVLGEVLDYLADDLAAWQAGDTDARDAVSSDELAEALGRGSGKALAQDFRDVGLKPGPVRVPGDNGEDVQKRGYRFADITAAIDKQQATIEHGQ